jgi:hypothetical protein
MATFNTFSKRQKGRPASFTYDALPDPLRLQVRLVLMDAMGMWPEGWALVEGIMEREHPLPTFHPDGGSRHQRPDPYTVQCVVSGDFDEAIDGIETGLRALNVVVRRQPSHHAQIYGVKQTVDDAIVEVNARFIEHGVGYQFSPEENQIVRLDSELLHAEAVEPAMRLLSAPGFEGPADEFRQAHAYHRAGNGKDAISWSVKALESTLKAICVARSWKYDAAKAGAKDLIDTVVANGLVPAELEGHFGGLRSALTCGLPMLGNRMTRHGQGATVRPIADHLVTYGMHLAASAIVFLVQANQAAVGSS